MQRLFSLTLTSASLLQDLSPHSCASKSPQDPAQSPESPTSSPAARCQVVSPSTRRWAGPTWPVRTPLITSSSIPLHFAPLWSHSTLKPAQGFSLWPVSTWTSCRSSGGHPLPSLLHQDSRCSLFPIGMSLFSLLPSSLWKWKPYLIAAVPVSSALVAGVGNVSKEKPCCHNLRHQFGTLWFLLQKSALPNSAHYLNPELSFPHP